MQFPEIFKLLRLPLLPVAVLLELALLAVGWLLAFVSPRLAGRVVALAKRLPGIDWYMGRQ